MKKRDPRINVSNMSFINYAAVFALVFFACGVFAWILYGISTAENNSDLYIVLSLLTGVVVLSVFFLLFFSILRRRFLSVHVDNLCSAARKVAQGDFSVRIAPERKDGKKDEFEVLYEDFNTMVAELASTEILKSDFISTVSHEIKTPIAVIQNYALMLQMSHLSEEERANCAEKISEATQRLSSLVTNILQLNKLENQNMPVKRECFNLSEQIRCCALGFEKVWTDKNIDFECNLDEDIEINSDDKLLYVVWNNLIGNALKFTEDGGTVTVTAEKSENYAAVTVKDSGCGIDDKTLSHIFDKFYQGDTSRATEGNGLGLALVKRIVTLLHCDIIVNSTPGEGSEFIIKIPFDTI